MRVIAGSAKGRTLRSVPGCGTRPITARVKQALFDILAPFLPEAGVLDLFARLSNPAFGELGMGVDNLLDKTWANHLNRANQDPFNPDPVQVNEPGRILWVNWSRVF